MPSNVKIFIMLGDQLSTLLILISLSIFVQAQLATYSMTTFDRIVWVYLQDFEHMNKYESLCLKNVEHYARQSNYDVRLITAYNYTEYIKEIIDYEEVIATQFIEKDLLKKALIQLTILEKFGGVWIDLPLMLTESLEWMSTIKNQRHINNRIDDINAILFYTPQWFEPTFKRTAPKVEDLVVYPKYHSWFVGMKKECEFIRDWRKLFIEIVKKSQSQLDQLYQVYDLNPREYLLNSKLFLQWTANAVIKIMQTELDKQYGTSSSSRRLAINYYKSSAISTDDSAYLLSNQAKEHTHLTTKYFTQVSAKELQLKFAYLLRSNEKVTEEIESIIDPELPMTEHLHSSVELVCEDEHVPYRHIISSSVVDSYLLKINPSSPIKTYSAEFIKHHCSVTYESVFYEFLMTYLFPAILVFAQLYMVRRMILVFKPQWGIRRKRTI